MAPGAAADGRGAHMLAAELLQQQGSAPAPHTPAEWGLWVALVGLFGKMLWDVALRLLPSAKAPDPPKPAEPAAGAAGDVLAALERLESDVRDVRDLVRALNQVHDVRGPTGDPVWYCAARDGGLHQVQQGLARLEHLVGRVLDHQRQGNGLLSKLARRIRERGRHQGDA